ncbi:MAG TPA: Flp family type IVb pilin [Candidatus Baltobacteraceae bacterium]|nr:Flp family type IVb pilin [Candidatus Baltobacteraceae bacterium]
MDFWRDESGLGIVEYGLILALVAMVAIGALLVFGNDITASVDRVGNDMPSASITGP